MATDGFRPLPSHYDRCFGCGRDHPTGLHLEMWGLDDELRVRGSFTVTEHHQGAPGLAHGGVISAAVDEGMGYLLWLVGSPAVTARLEVDFRRPVPVVAGASRPGGPAGGPQDLSVHAWPGRRRCGGGG
jgi:Thioesterase superfamily